MAKREFQRIPLNAAVQIRVVSQDDVRRGRVKNISGSGILFTSQARLEPGMLCHLEVMTQTYQQFSHGIEPMHATVRVVRVVGDDAPYEVAAEFIRITLP